MLDATLSRLINDAVSQKADAVAIVCGKNILHFNAVLFEKMHRLGQPGKAEVKAAFKAAGVAGQAHHADPCKRLIIDDLPEALRHVVVSHPIKTIALLKLAYAKPLPVTAPLISTPKWVTDDERARYVAMAGIPGTPLSHIYTQANPLVVSLSDLILNAKDIGAKDYVKAIRQDAPATMRIWALPTYEDCNSAAYEIFEANQVTRPNAHHFYSPGYEPGSRLYAFAASTNETAVEAVGFAKIRQTFRPLENTLLHGVDDYQIRILHGAPEEALIVGVTALLKAQIRYDFYRLACQIADEGIEVALDARRIPLVHGEVERTEWIRRSEQHIIEAIRNAKSIFPVFDGERRDLALSIPRQIAETNRSPDALAQCLEEAIGFDRFESQQISLDMVIDGVSYERHVSKFLAETSPDELRDLVRHYRETLDTSEYEKQRSGKLPPPVAALSIAEHQLYGQTFDCLACGACCRHAGQVALNDRDKHTVPAPYNRSVRGVKGFDSYDWQNGRRCLSKASDGTCRALKGEIGKTVSCKIYDVRPDACSDFTPGCGNCLESRESAGLPISHGRNGEWEEAERHLPTHFYGSHPIQPLSKINMD